jgi:hypothetical protein
LSIQLVPATLLMVDLLLPWRAAQRLKWLLDLAVQRLGYRSRDLARHLPCQNR